MKKVLSFITLTTIFSVALLFSNLAVSYAVGEAAFWSFEESSGATASDSSGNDNTLNLVNTLWEAGVEGSGLSFNGSSSYAYINDASLTGSFPAASTNPAGDFSISSWIYLDRVPSDRNVISSKQGTSVAGVSRGFMFSAGNCCNARTLVFEIWSSDSSNTSLKSNSALEPDRWYYVTATYDFVSEGNSSMKLYIDGIEDASINTAVGPVQGNPQPLDIGRYYWSGGYSRYFGGTIDELRFFNTELTAQEVLDIFNQTTPPGPNLAPDGIIDTPLGNVSINTGDSINFTGTGTDPDGNLPLTYEWDFGGAFSTSTLEDPGNVQFDIAGIYNVRFTVTDSLGISDPTPASVEVTVLDSGLPFPLPNGPWWDSGWAYRIASGVEVGPYGRTDKPVEVSINFTNELSSIGVLGTFDENSLRVIEVDESGAVVDENVVFQFDKDASFDSSSNASGILIFLLSGTTSADSIRYFHVYFDINGKSFTAPQFANQITLTDGINYEGEESYKIETQDATYYYHKAGAGFASMVDKNGIDWIGYHEIEGSESAGEYRGIPNLPDFGHPGGGTSYGGQYRGSSSIINQGPIKLTIKSIRYDGAAELLWEIYPYYVKSTVVQMPKEYIWGYEGTPGGSVEASSDYRVYSDGTQINLNSNSNTDLPNPEWLYFGDPATSVKIFVSNHQNEDFIDEYWTMNNEMTVFGFGRDGSNYQLNTFPAYFTFGFSDTADYANTAININSAYQDMNVVLGDSVVQAKEFIFQRVDWTNTPGGVGAVRIGDVDNDGDNDIVGLGGRNLFVFENLGNGSWNPTPDNCPTTSGCDVGPYYDLDSTGQAGLNGMVLFDVDSDGDLDAIGAKYHDNLGWWENPGGSIGTDPWVFYSFYSTTRYLHDMELVDLDGDGQKKEILASTHTDYWNADIDLLWFRVGEGPSGPSGNWTAYTIAPTFNEGSDHGHAGLGTGDIDADGDIDISYSNGWFEAPTNPEGSGWIHHEITSIYGISNSIPADIDNDGDLDLVMSAGHHGQGVYWFENTGTPRDNNSWGMHKLHDTIGDINSRYYYNSADEGITVIHPEGLNVLDIDFDGDMDVMATEIFFGEDLGEPKWDTKSHNIYLFENKGGKPVDKSGWVRHNISPDSWPNHSIRAVDLNEDGLMDIVTEGPVINNISYLENVSNISVPPPPPPTNQNPNGVIDTPSSDVLLETGGSVNFTGTGTDPDGNLPLTYEWTFGGTIANSNQEDPGYIIFNTIGVYTVNFTVTDSEGLSDMTPASVVVTVVDPASPPVITTQPQSITIDESQTAVLSVVAETTDGSLMTYQWQASANTIWQDIINEIGSSLTFSNANPLDTGDYRVVVTNSVGSVTSDTATLTVNGIAPILSNGFPTGALPFGTTQTSLSLSTNETAECKYDTVAGTTFSSMSNTFSNTNSTFHDTIVSGLVDGQSYDYFVRCQDVYGTANSTDYQISFSVDQDVPPPSPDTGLVTYWKFDELSGNQAADTTSNGNILSINTSNWVSGHLNNAINLNGSSNYGFINDVDLTGAFPASSTNPAEDFTISAWIYLDRVPTDRNVIASKQGTTGGSPKRGFMFSAGNCCGARTLVFEAWANDGSLTSVKSTSTLDANRWYYVTVTYDYVASGSSKISLYIDGIEVGSTATAVGPVQGNPQPLDIGRYYWSGGYSRYFGGTLDELRFYDRALSASEIASLAGN